MIPSFLHPFAKFFVPLFLILLYANGEAFAQTANPGPEIEIPDFRGSAKTLLEHIESQENLTLSYSSEISLNFDVEFERSTSTLDHFLSTLFEKKPIGYRISGTRILLFPSKVSPQVTQVVRGRVIDQQTKVELIGANIIIEGTTLGAATDINGNFRIPRVPLGRHSLKVSYLGYKQRIVPEVVVGSAKEVVLVVELEEEILKGQEITVLPGKEKGRPLNPISTVSARSFSVEETRRYAGGFDDPARLASCFAGVTYGNPQDNAIIIRGNAPKGLLWRLEGIEIPNPNHFPEGNVMGGGLFTIFSNHLLSDSDFFTGAFPAEYGNALSGVFDIKFRNGNNEVREYTFQTGMLGIDFSTEGPFSYKSKASYLINYRYSTLGLMTDLNIIDSEQEIRYQDLSFKFNFPTRKAGTFSLWGIGSLDDLVETEEPDSTQWEQDFDRVQFDGAFNTGAAGLNHKYILGKSTFINSTAAISMQEILYDMDRLDDNLHMRDNEYVESLNGKVTVTSIINHKYSARFNQVGGIIWNYLFYDMDFKATTDNDPGTYETYVREEGNSQLIQAFTQAQYNLTPSLKVNGGIHYLYFPLNSSYSIEPRTGISYDIHPRHRITFGYGRHSQLEDLQYYLAVRENEAGVSYMPNKDLEFTKADHFVLGYEYQLSSNTYLKIEPYYQYLFDVPVIPDSSFSMINLKDERYINDVMTNEGTGTNYGVDITLEKFLSNNYYYMITGSLFESKYKGGDGVERDTRYNRHYVFNVLGGKEFRVKENNVLGLNGRFTYTGGERIHPVLRNASLREKRVILDGNRAFEDALPANLYLDVTISYRMNHQRAAHVVALMIKNALGNETDYGYIYNYQTQSIEKDRMVITIPTLNYKIEF